MTTPPVAGGPRRRSPTNGPVPKVASAGLGGAAATIVIAIIEASGGDVSPVLAAAIATVIAFLAGYITPPGGP